jgi:hypothetical protein
MHLDGDERRVEAGETPRQDDGARHGRWRNAPLKRLRQV